jgi:hypothetical protein
MDLTKNHRRTPRSDDGATTTLISKPLPPAGIVTSTTFTGHYLLRCIARIHQIRRVSGAVKRGQGDVTR